MFPLSGYSVDCPNAEDGRDAARRWDGTGFNIVSIRRTANKPSASGRSPTCRIALTRCRRKAAMAADGGSADRPPPAYRHIASYDAVARGSRTGLTDAFQQRRGLDGARTPSHGRTDPRRRNRTLWRKAEERLAAKPVPRRFARVEGTGRWVSTSRSSAVAASIRL